MRASPRLLPNVAPHVRHGGRRERRSERGKESDPTPNAGSDRPDRAPAVKGAAIRFALPRYGILRFLGFT